MMEFRVGGVIGDDLASQVINCATARIACGATKGSSNTCWNLEQLETRRLRLYVCDPIQTRLDVTVFVLAGVAPLRCILQA